MRSHDQWNTTIYSNDDRYRGVRNIREMVLMNRKDMRERGLEEGDLVDIVATSRDGSERSVHAFRALGYNLPRGARQGTCRSSTC
jgi:anaerobic selenocysteine-containing dehydrogenase